MYSPQREAPAFAFVRFFIIGGGVISFAGGIVNACTLLSSFAVASTHMTGLLTQLAVESVGAEAIIPLGYVAGLVGAFTTGAAISGAVLESSRLRFSHRYGYLLMLEAAILALSTYFLLQGQFYGVVLASLAAGLQNALATQYSSAVLRTTHVTGIITDLGVSFGRRLRGAPTAPWRVWLLLALLLGYGLGSVFGGLIFMRIGAWTMAIPSAIVAICAIIYWRRRIILDHASIKILGRNSTTTSSHSSTAAPKTDA